MNKTQLIAWINHRQRTDSQLGFKTIVELRKKAQIIKRTTNTEEEKDNDVPFPEFNNQNFI